MSGWKEFNCALFVHPNLPVSVFSVKTEFEEQKEAELEDLRRRLSSEQEEKEQSYTSKMSQLTAQLEQLDAVVAQVLHPQCVN